LLRQHYDRVYGLCRRMLCNDCDAEDATQDALVAAVKGLGHFDGRSSFGTWLHRIAVNTCIDQIRRRRRRPQTVSVEVESARWDSLPPPGALQAVAHGDSHAELVAAHVDLDSAMGRLDPDFRAAVLLRVLCDFTYEEISSIVDVPLGTVKSRIARGRAALAEMLGNFGPTVHVEDTVLLEDSRSEQGVEPQASTEWLVEPQGSTE
jgi:RNA polymerase sigma-70 factor (ECF subfamily)